MPRLGDIVDGRYRLLRLLGRGGMGEVYEAVHTDIGVHVALKFLNQRDLDDPTALIRLKREARAAGAIGHPAIIGVQDLGATEEGSFYLVMELLRGQSLGERLGFVRQLDSHMVAYIGSQVLSGLAAAHKVNIIHRDLKSENIFLVDTGAPLPGVKILDFGISQVIEGSNIQGDTRLTQEGMVVGTPAYMSPEQARGIEVDRRSDLFSLGVILHECLTGSLPFDGANYNSIVAAILTEEPTPPRAVRPEIPEPIERIVLKALTRDREHRYQSASEMLQELLLYVEEKAVGHIPVPDDLAYDGDGLELIEDYEEPDPVVGMPTCRGQSTTGLWWMNDSEKRRWVSGAKWQLITAAIVVSVVIALGATVGIIWFGNEDDLPLTVPQGQLIGTSSSQDTATSSQDSAPPPQALPSTSKVSTINLDINVEGAKVYLNDALIDNLPLRLSRSGPIFSLRVEAEGYRPYISSISPSEDRTISIEMAPNEPETPERPHIKRGRKRWNKTRTKTTKQNHDPSYLVPPPSVEYLEDR